MTRRDRSKTRLAASVLTMFVAGMPAAAGAQFLFCGDGILSPELGEECDDGNGRANDGCSRYCEIEPWTCGDGVAEGTEQCDDGNLQNGDGCDSYCLLEHGGGGYCGDGILDVVGGEQCDDGNNNPGDFCSPDCQFEFCGNGILDFGEECDDGNYVAGDGCSPTCTIGVDPNCGNGILEFPPEHCDDGNLIDGDGCTSTCLTEFCGNGVLETANGEECDDGNFLDGDGCSALCAVEMLIECCVDRDGDGWMTEDLLTADDCAEFGFPRPKTPQYVPCGGAGGIVREDCDDADPAIHPAAVEIPNNAIDENCNGTLTCGAVDDDAPGAARALAALAPLAAVALLRRRMR